MNYECDLDPKTNLPITTSTGLVEEYTVFSVRDEGTGVPLGF